MGEIRRKVKIGITTTKKKRMEEERKGNI